MPDYTIKQENIKNYHVSLESGVRYDSAVYIVTLAVDYGNTGLYSEVKTNITPDRKNALATYRRYKRSISE